MTSALSAFLLDALNVPPDNWDHDRILHLSRLHVPDQIFMGRRELLQGDISHLWATWFLEAFCDPKAYLSCKGPTNYALIYHRVLSTVDVLLAPAARQERISAAKAIATLLTDEIERRVTDKRRTRLDREYREDLVDAVSPQVRCWICGFRFSDAAVERFLNG